MRRIFLPLLLMLAAANIRAADIKVLLAEPRSSIEIRASGPFTVLDLGDNKKYKITKGGSFKISKHDKTLHTGSVKTDKGAQIMLADSSDHFTVNSAQYRGPLVVKQSSNGIYIIEVVQLEDYLQGVLPYEMSHSWPLEALKAQAVAARTYTLKVLPSRKKRDFDLYSDVRDQMYKGSVKIYDSVKKAVNGTKGEVLLFKGELFHTFYHANCGGHTNGAVADVKPLSGAKCGYCESGNGYKWEKTLSKEAVNNYLKKNNIAGTFKSMKVGKKAAGGRAETLVLTTTKQTKEVNCNAFRLAVGSTTMKSCLITKINGLKLQGRGYGHGKGLCQEGAKGMAQAGKDYRDILDNYYPGSKINKI